MCTGLREWMEENRAEGIDEKTRKVVANMLKRGFEDEEIMLLTECGQTLVDEVKRELA